MHKRPTDFPQRRAVETPLLEKKEEENRLILGDATDEQVTAGKGNDEIYGDAGDDFLKGMHGEDYLSGGKGKDILVGGFDADTFAFDGDFDQDRVWDFDAGFDKLEFVLYRPEQKSWTVETILSFAKETKWGVIIDFPDSDEKVTLNKVTLEDLKKSEINVKFVETKVENQLIFAGDADDTVTTGAGNDEIYGQRGDDLLSGKEGRDYLSGGQGTDTLIGGADADTFAFDGNFGSDRVEDFDAELDMLEFVLYEPHQMGWTAKTMLDAAKQTGEGVMFSLPDLDGDVFLYKAELSSLNDDHINVVYYGDSL